MSENVIIGVNILETLTTGMYTNPFTIFREYIQNSCDSIDEAIEDGILNPNDATIEINIVDDNVYIEDNGIGIKAKDFRKTLYNIGDSQKTAGQNKGFRGIGHWCGFAHCSSVVFTAKSKDERVESIMRCNAGEIRKKMSEHRTKKVIYTIDEVLSSTIEFSTNEVNVPDLHYFKVEMFGIVDERLCDEQTVKDYLSFISPVDYATQFRFSTIITNHAKEISQPIQVYQISVNGETILKKYQPTFSTRTKGEDTVTDVKFQEFKDDDGRLVAWLWFGVSSFKAQIHPICKMRGIRLRTHNIQLGTENALLNLFPEPRGIHYYIGEIFTVSEKLLPNSQRDYLEPCRTLRQLEESLREFFDTLTKIYYDGSKINSNIGKTQSTDPIVVNEANRELDKIRAKNETKLKENEKDIHVEVVREILSTVDIHTQMDQSPTRTPVKSKTRSSSTDKMVSLNKVRKIIRTLAEHTLAEKIIKRIEKDLT